MNLKGLALLSLTFFTFIIMTYAVSAGWCYQETATIATECGGLATGNYDSLTPAIFMYSIDGNWATMGNAFGSGYINYTKPVGAKSSSIWQILDSRAIGMGVTNLSLPQSCWDYDSTTLILRVDSSSEAFWFCYNGAWIQISRSWSNNLVYEEAMIWNIEGGIEPPIVNGTNWTEWKQGIDSWKLVIDEWKTQIESSLLSITNSLAGITTRLDSAETTINSQDERITRLENQNSSVNYFMYMDTADKKIILCNYMKANSLTSYSDLGLSCSITSGRKGSTCSCQQVLNV